MPKVKDAFPDEDLAGLSARISACRLCAAQFRATATAHEPRPVVWLRPDPAVLIAAQAPGIRVQEVGKPFWDRSGDRLREWMGIDRETFYDRDLISVLPTAFCFPGYDANGADLPPPPICWQTWHAQVLAKLGRPRLRLVIGQYAIRRHLGLRGSLTENIRNWRNHAPDTFVLPHPSWRNNSWLHRNPWFITELLPELRIAVARALNRAA